LSFVTNTSLQARDTLMTAARSPLGQRRRSRAARRQRKPRSTRRRGVARRPKLQSRGWLWRMATSMPTWTIWRCNPIDAAPLDPCQGQCFVCTIIERRVRRGACLGRRRSPPVFVLSGLMGRGMARGLKSKTFNFFYMHGSIFAGVFLLVWGLGAAGGVCGVYSLYV
jgi:hypothetical protein